MNTQRHNDSLDNDSVHAVGSLLRSVSYHGPDSIRLRPVPVLGKRLSSEPLHLTKAIQANGDHVHERPAENGDEEDTPCHTDGANCVVKSEEDHLQDFLKWSSQLSIPLLPEVSSSDCPLMPTRMTLQGVSLLTITQSISQCLQRLQAKNIMFAYRAHPDHTGRIEICSTQCRLKFVIQLWQQKQQQQQVKEDNDVKPASAVVVELQRRRGCPIFMHHLRRSLFQTLGALATSSKTTTKITTLPHPTLLRLTRDHHESLPEDPIKRIHSVAKPPVIFPPPLRVNFS